MVLKASDLGVAVGDRFLQIKHVYRGENPEVEVVAIEKDGRGVNIKHLHKGQTSVFGINISSKEKFDEVFKRLHPVTKRGTLCV